MRHYRSKKCFPGYVQTRSTAGDRRISNIIIIVVSGLQPSMRMVNLKHYVPTFPCFIAPVLMSMLDQLSGTSVPSRIESEVLIACYLLLMCHV